MARRRVNTTKYEIIQEATRLFLEKGYSATTPKLICDALDISTGNLTYYFPTKEHLLAELIKMLCSFQGKTIQYLVQDEGTTSLLAVCLELATMLSICEEDAVAKEIFLAAYTSSLCLQIIRENDAQRAKRIYSEFCPDWSDQQYIEAEALVSGIEYASLMTTGDELTLESRIIGALNNIMSIYNVPEQTRRIKINKVLAMDYRKQGKQVLQQFKAYVEQMNGQMLDPLFAGI